MQWTKGHETHEVNIAADRLATEGREDAILGDW
jgi:ribonuclease HI